MADYNRRDSESDYGRSSSRSYDGRRSGGRYSQDEDRSAEEYRSDEMRFQTDYDRSGTGRRSHGTWTDRDREFNGGGDRSYGQQGEYRSRSSRMDDQFRPSSQGDRWQNRSSGYGSSEDYGYGSNYGSNYGRSANYGTAGLYGSGRESYNDYGTRSGQGRDYDSSRSMAGEDDRSSSTMNRDYGTRRGTSDYESLGAMGTSSWQGSSYGTRDSASRMNHLGKGPKGWKRSDERIREDVCERLERDAHVDASEIEVSVKDGVVTLAGKVEDRPSKRHTEDLIENMPGVKDVRNELSVDQSFFQQAKDMIMGRSETDKISTSSTNTTGTKSGSKTAPH